MVIGWYVHHHGHGHVARFLAVQPHLRTPVVVFSSMRRPAALAPEVEWVELPTDADGFEDRDGVLRDPRDADPTVRGHLHWAPHGHPDTGRGSRPSPRHPSRANCRRSSST